MYDKVVGDVLVSWLLNTQQKPSRPGFYWKCCVQTNNHPSSSFPFIFISSHIYHCSLCPPQWPVHGGLFLAGCCSMYCLSLHLCCFDCSLPTLSSQ